MTNAAKLISRSGTITFYCIVLFQPVPILTFIYYYKKYKLNSGFYAGRIRLLPVTHVLVDTWMLTVKLVYKLSNVPDDLKQATNTHMTPFTLTFKA